jgi:asparagine synthase (glutamine-hydrolysing)
MSWSFLAVIGAETRRREMIAQWNLAERLRGKGLGKPIELAGMSLFASVSAPMTMLGLQAGAVIGRVFRTHADAPSPIARFSDTEAVAIVESRGVRLVDLYWGPHVALISTEDGESIVQRDPSGGLAVFRLEAGGVTVFAADPDLLVSLALVEPRVDDAFVRHWLLFPHLRTARTGIEPVAELLPGTAWRWRGGKASIETRWTPWTFAARGAQIDDFDEACDRLRATAMRTIPAYATGSCKPLLELSGGLDSSIIAGALGARGVRFAAVNFATLSADGDERPYARMAAAAAGAPLVEVIEQKAAPDLATIPPPRLRPGLSPVLQPIHDGFRTAAQRLGADLFMSGAGGDSLFCYLTTASPALDAAATRGMPAGLASLADVSRLCGCTVWTACRFALRKAIRRRGRWRREPLFLARDLDAMPDHHPWLDASAGALPGKREHVEALVTIFHFLDRGVRGPLAEAAYPLMSQPLMELCLRLPSWMWIRGGRNRAVAREAFRGLVPDPILARGGKGRLESMCATGYLQSRPVLRTLLLEGALARRGIIDRPAIEDYLRLNPQKDDPRFFRVFDLATMEMWLRSWGQC